MTQHADAVSVWTENPCIHNPISYPLEQCAQQNLSQNTGNLLRVKDQQGHWRW